MRLKNPKPRENAVLGGTGTYLEGFSPVQVGSVDCIIVGLPEPDRTKQSHQLKTKKEREWNRLELPVAERERRRAKLAAKLPTRSDENGNFQPCAPQPYLRWSSIADAEVILKLKPSQVEVLDDGASPLDGKTDREVLELLERRTRVTNALLKDLGKQVSNLTRNSSKRRWFWR